jgi:hypothetical protein
MSTTPIIIETIMPLGQIQAGQQALRDLGPAADVASTGFHNAAAASSEFDHEIQFVNTQNIRARASFDEATAGATEFGYSVREARGGARLLADELGIHLNRELANTLARSEVIGPVLEKAFGALAIAGFVQMGVEAVKTMAEWADESEKAAETQAKFERALIKSNEELDHQKERAAGLINPMAEAAQRAADYGDKALDITSETKDLNAALESGPSLWGSVKQAIGDATIYTGLFLGIVDPAMRALTHFNEEVAQGAKEQKDLAPAIAQVDGKIKELQADLHEAESVGGFKGFWLDITGTTDEINRSLKLEREYRQSLHASEQASNQDDLNEQAEQHERLLASQQHATEARLAYEESALARELKLHRTSYDDERAELLKLEDERNRAATAELAAREAMLSQQKAQNPKTDFSAAEAGLKSEGTAEYYNHKKAVEQINAEANAQILKSDQETSEAQIDYFARVTAALDRQAEERAKRVLDKADTPQEIDAAQEAYAKALAKDYADQNSELRAKAANLQAVLAIQNPTAQGPTADLGTDEYAKQLENIRTIAPEIYTALLEMNARMRQITTEGQDAQEASLFAANERKLEIARQGVENYIRLQNEQVEESKAAYQRDLSAIQALYQEKEITGITFLSKEKALAEEEYRDRVAALEREAAAVREAASKGVLTEEAAAKKLIEIYQQESKAHEEMLQKEETETQKAALKMQQEMQKYFTQVTTELNSNLNQWINGHEKFSQAVTKAWDQMVLKAADSILQIGEKWAVGLVLQQGTQEKQVLMDAKTAAANAWANAPNPVVGAVEAAVTFAAIVGSYMPTFERGGIVPGFSGDAVPILAHAKEMVLPEHISTFVQDAAAGKIGSPGPAGATGAPGGSASGGDTYHTTHQRNNFELHVHGGKTDKNDVISWVKEGVRSGSLP